MKKNEWSAYGKWRSSVYPEISFEVEEMILFMKYGLPDLRLISVQRAPYQWFGKRVCIYPNSVQPIKSEQQ
jgi:hypothetical protein